jgi:hypothetical protein
MKKMVDKNLIVIDSHINCIYRCLSISMMSLPKSMLLAGFLPITGQGWDVPDRYWGDKGLEI